MPLHDVNFTLPERPLGKVDADFIVHIDGEPFGKLKVSHGAVVWIPKHGRNHRRLSWTALAGLFEEHGTMLKKVKR
jgi:hypothetical protein